jgi:hypothetical protein
MNMTLGAQALLERVARGETTDDDANRLRQWLFPGEQAKIVQSYLLLCCNAENVNTYIAPDLRLHLATYLLRGNNGAMNWLDMRRLFADAIDLYDEYQEQHGYEREEARAAAIRDTLEGLDASIDLLKEDEP